MVRACLAFALGVFGVSGNTHGTDSLSGGVTLGLTLVAVLQAGCVHRMLTHDNGDDNVFSI